MWTVETVKRDLPDVMVRNGRGNKPIQARVSGRLNQFATVSITTRLGFVDWQVSWATIADVLNRNTSILVDFGVPIKSFHSTLQSAISPHSLPAPSTGRWRIYQSGD